MVDDGGEFGLTSREASPTREAPNRHTRGSRKYKEMVERGSRAADQKNLPFTFSKPKRQQSRTVVCVCPTCGQQTSVTKTTVLVICGACPTLFSINENTLLSQ